MAENGEKDYKSYVGKEPTNLHEHLSEWIQEKTGYDPATARSKQQAFLKGIQLSALLRMDHQASPENQQRRANLAKAAKPEATEGKASKPAKGKGAAKEATETAAKPAASKRARGPKPAATATADAAF